MRKLEITLSHNNSFQANSTSSLSTSNNVIHNFPRSRFGAVDKATESHVSTLSSFSDFESECFFGDKVRFK